MIALDASVLIAHFAVSDPHADAALDILETEEELVIHPLNLAEVLVRPAQLGQADAVVTTIAALSLDVATMTSSDATRWRNYEPRPASASRAASYC